MAETFEITNMEAAYIVGGLKHLLHAIVSGPYPHKDRDSAAVEKLIRKFCLSLDLEPETLDRLGVRDFTGNA